MLEKIRLSLRMTNTSLDEEILDCIAECLADLKREGIQNTSFDDPLVSAAIRHYARWQFNFEGAAERYEKTYAALRSSMALSGDYGSTQGDGDEE